MDRDNNKGRRRQADEENVTDEEKERREKNRKAAQKCRLNKHKQLEELKQKNKELEEENKQLSDDKKELIKQTKKYKGLVDLHCEKGCKIPEEMIQIWNMWSSEVMDAASSDEDVSDGDMLHAAGFTEEIQTRSRHLSNTQETCLHLQKTPLDDCGPQVEAPTALFSGERLDAHQVNRRRSNSSSNSLPAPRVTSDQLLLTNTSSPKRNDNSSFLAHVSVPSPSASASSRFPKDVEMQMKKTATPARTRNNTANVMSNSFLKAENVPNMVTISHNLTQFQNQQAFPATQPRLETETHGQRFDSSSKPEENPIGQVTMEYQNVAEAEVRPLSSEDMSNQDSPPSTYVVESVENYTYLEDLMKSFSSNDHTESGNDGIQGPNVGSNHVCSSLQNLTQSQPTVPLHTMAPALLSIAPEMSPSLQQQFKTSLNSLPNQATHTIAGTDVISTNQNVMTKPQVEVHIASNRRQIRLGTQGVLPVIASRQVGPRSETTSSIDMHSAIDWSLSMPQEMATYKATVLSPKQLFMVQAKQIAGKNPYSGGFTGRKQALQQDIQHEQHVTWPSATNEATSMAGNSQSRINDTDIFSFSRSGLNIPHSALQSVPQKIKPRTINQVVASTVTSQSYSSTSSQFLHSTTSDQIKQRSFIQMTNGVSSHGHNRREATATNDVYINTTAGNSPSQQLASQTTIANNTNSGFIPNFAIANNVAYNSSPQFRPQANGHNPHANNADCTSTPVARNISTEPGDQYPSKVPTTSASSGHQSIINPRLPLKPPSFPQELQVSKSVNVNPPNTEASCGGTDIADQVLTTTSSETLLQPTNKFSGVYFLSQQGPTVDSVNNLSMVNTPTGTYDYITSQYEDVNCLSTSLEMESGQLVNTAENPPTTISDNPGIGNSCQIEESLNLNIPNSFIINSIAGSQTIHSADDPNTELDIASFTSINTSLVDDFQRVSNQQSTPQPISDCHRVSDQQSTPQPTSDFQGVSNQQSTSQPTSDFIWVLNHQSTPQPTSDQTHNMQSNVLAALLDALNHNGQA